MTGRSKGQLSLSNTVLEFRMVLENRCNQSVSKRQALNPADHPDAQF